ncbi:hypothetical protein [Pseudohongiella spirulinae]|uniref:DUF4019 domain-containing protein n=1 Tax=Pseudohongiella spirulinae TaxID=1249552 RepID=A0A0S2KBG8_9GAMM|nr:hypothetical protein [Pseudohongiella spirulinae]ALO45670.1 hypothetical protein PS2015_1001 [Pseudohongiella spirulinae]
MARWLGIFLLICMLATAGFALFNSLRHQQQKTVADTLVVDVTSTSLRQWDPAPVIARTHPDFYLQNSNEALINLFDALRRLGDLSELRDITFVQDELRWWQSVTGMTIHYTMQANFERGNAEVRISMIFDQGEWKIANYQVLSSIMAA